MRLDIAQHEGFQRWIRKAQTCSFGTGALDVPLVDQYALHQPHAGRSITAGAMNESRLVSWTRDCLKEAVHSRRVHCSVVEGDVVKVDARGLCSSRFGVDIGALFR